MSAVLDVLKLRRRRPVIPGIDTDHYGTGAVDEQAGLGLRRPPVFRLPTEGNGMEGAALDDSLGPRRVFTEAPPAPALEEALAPRPVRRYTPPTFGQPAIETAPDTDGVFVPRAPAPSFAEDLSLAPIPPEALAARRRFTKPTFESTGDQRADLARYEQGLSQWRDPADRNGRLKSFGLGALRGLLRGLATGQGLGAGIGGALAGGVHGAVSPNADERAWRDEERMRTQGELARVAALDDMTLSRRAKVAGIAKTEAEVDALKNPKLRQVNRQHVKVGNKVYVFNPADGSLTDSGVEGGPEWKTGTDEQGVFLYDPARPDAPVRRLTGAEAKRLREITVGGQTFKVPETEAARILGGIEAADTAASNQFGGQSYSDDVKRVEQENEATKARHSEAGKAVEQLRQAIRAREGLAAKVRDAKARADNPPPRRVGKEVYGAEPEDVARYQAEFQSLLTQFEAADAQIRALGDNVRQNYGEFVDDDPATRWPTLLRPAPRPKPLPSRQAPRLRGGGGGNSQRGGSVTNATPSSVMSVIERVRNRR